VDEKSLAFNLELKCHTVDVVKLRTLHWVGVKALLGRSELGRFVKALLIHCQYTWLILFSTC
jgi:hypothetical protein